MKTNNIFDYLETDPENIDESTIYEMTGVNADNVKEIFMSKLNNSKETTNKNETSKTGKTRKSGKKIFVTAVAATVAALAVATVTAGAAGTFNPVFGELFAGEPVDGMYSGGNLSIKSSSVDVECKGVMGDTREAWAVMSITKKDKSAFVDTDDVNGIDIHTLKNVYDDSEYYDTEYEANADDASVTCTKSLWDRLTNGNRYGSGSVHYEFEDKNTIRAIVYYGDSDCNVLGETLTIKDQTLYTYDVDEVLYKFDEIGTENGTVYDGNMFTKIQNEYSSKIGENQCITVTTIDNCFCIVSATKGKIDLDYEVSVKLNYKDNTRRFDTNGWIIDGSDCSYKVKSLEVQPLTMKMEIETVEIDDDEIENGKIMEEMDILKITLDNGKVFDAVSNSLSMGYDVNTKKTNGNFLYDIRDSEKGLAATIDPSKVVSIKANGVEILK